MEGKRFSILKGGANSSFFVCLLLLVMTLAVYLPVRSCEFVGIDDWAYVTENKNVQSGLSGAGLKWAFQSHYAGNWHPLTTISHMLDCELFGLNAGAHHLTNLLFHLANTLLLFLVLRIMTGAVWRSALVAAFFALHPLHVESVAWVSERKDVLSAFFALWSLLFYTKYVKSVRSEVADDNDRYRSSISYCFALLFFALGLMSKPMVITLPFLLFLLDYWPLERFRDFQPNLIRKLILEKVPFIFLIVCSSFVTFWAQKAGGAVVTLDEFPLSSRMANALVSYERYLEQTFWPHSLAVFYPYKDLGGWLAWRVLGATILFFSQCAVALFFFRRRPYLFVGWFWFVGMLVPVIGLVQVGSQALADRYTYLPLTGIFVLVAWGLSEWFKSFPRLVPVFLAITALSACVGMTRHQLGFWKNSETLLEHATQVVPGNGLAHYHLGAIYETRGRKTEAEAHYIQAIRFLPNATEPHRNLADLRLRENKLVEAAQEYEAALRGQPYFAEAHYGLANVLQKQRKREEAKAHYLQAVRIKPDYAEAHYQIAVVLDPEKETKDVVFHFREAIRLKPDWVEALNNLAWIFATQKNENFRSGPEALLLAERADKLTRGSDPGVLDTLAAAYACSQQFDKAISTANKAVALASGPLQEEIRSRLKFYQSGRPFIQ